MLIFLRNILQLILAPSRGWEDIGACDTDINVLMRKGLYPFITVAALSEFLRLFHESDLSMPVLIITSLVVFVSFFVTYFLANVSFKTMLYRYTDTEPNERKYSTVILYTICLLSLSTIICNAMPVRLGLEYLLPLAVTMILWKANIYLCISSDKDLSFIFFGIITVILPPLLIQALFSGLIG